MSRAVVATAYGGPEVLAVVEQDRVEPGPGQVLVGMRAAGVNPADWKTYTGVWGDDPHKLPLPLGFELAGVVLAVGPAAHDEADTFSTTGTAGTDSTDRVAVGDEVVAHPVRGAYADEVLAPVSALVPKPPQLDWEEAAGLLVTGTTAVHALTATGVGAGDTVLVHGASGGVGALVVQLARLRGARVVGTAATANHDYVAELGAAPVAYGPGLEDRVRRAAPGGVTAAIDTVGTDEALDTSVALVPDRRRVASIAGFHRPDLGIRLLGSGPRADPGTAVRADARRRLVDLLAERRLRQHVGATYPLAEAAHAHRAGIDGLVRGKIVLVP